MNTRGMDGDLTAAAGKAAMFFKGLGKAYTDAVRVVTMAAHSTSSNDPRTFPEARMSVR